MQAALFTAANRSHSLVNMLTEEAPKGAKVNGGKQTSAGDQGKPIEKEGTGWLDEANLQQKELDQGESWFQLQHMLNTKLADAL